MRQSLVFGEIRIHPCEPVVGVVCVLKMFFLLQFLDAFTSYHRFHLGDRNFVELNKPFSLLHALMYEHSMNAFEIAQHHELLMGC